jgi:hypothetical protein
VSGLTNQPERSTVIARIDEVLAALRGSVSRNDLQAGWSEHNRTVVARVLGRLRDRLEDPRPLQLGDVRPSLTRDLDDLGIEPDNRLADQIAEIGVLSNRLP